MPAGTRDDRLGVIEARLNRLESEVREGFASVREEIRAGDESLRDQLRAEIRAGDEETRRLMLVLHEDLVDRIKALGEAR